jgi:UDP:flavonoid glycosyltransferase YjiC (YdhE family)
LTPRKRILLVGESVSLAHVGRPLALARALDPERYDVSFACDPRYEGLVRRVPGVRFMPLPSIPSDTFLASVQREVMIYRPEDIEAYLTAEAALLRDVRPDMIVSDFRWSMATSAELQGVPLAALANVHWSPYLVREDEAEPSRRGRWSRRLRSGAGRGLAEVRRRTPLLPTPWRAETETMRFNRARAKRGLPPVDGWFDLVTHGTFTLYAEPPGLFDVAPLPPHHMFLGAILWSPDAPEPAWWRTWDTTRPVVYVTLGSTGAADRLAAIVRELSTLPATIVVATAGRARLSGMGPNVNVADYLPGLEMAEHASVVVCNGGSGTVYQAAGQGTPVLGLWSNSDQQLTISMIERAGAGVGRPVRDTDPRGVRDLTARLLDDPGYRRRASALAAIFRAHDSTGAFRRFVERVLDAPGS